jgi:hypothetical protein
VAGSTLVSFLSTTSALYVYKLISELQLWLAVLWSYCHIINTLLLVAVII